MAPTVQTTKVMVGMGDLHFAPEGTAQPADSVDYQGTFTGWTFSGATEEGTSFTADTDVEDHYIEEQASPVFVTRNTRSVVLAAQLVEDTMATLKLALGGILATQAAATGVIGKETLTLSDDITKYAALLESKNPEGFFRRLHIPRGVIVNSVEVANRRAAAKRLYQVTFESTSATNTIKFTNKTANAL
jgi:hypothetical protein